MSKTLKYARNAAIAGGLASLTFNLIKQLIEINENPDAKFDWEEFIISGGKGVLIGGSAGLVVGGIKDINNSFEQPLNTNYLLKSAISQMTLDKQNYHYKWLSEKALKVEKFINSNFKDKLCGTILRFGSTEENTALADDFDIDISVPFAPYSFPSTEVMFDDLCVFFKNNFNDSYLAEIRPQKKSFGLIYNFNGHEFKIDIVPYKLSPKKGNNSSGYLFVNNNSFLKKDSYTKTDILSLKEIKLNPTQQKILVAIKIWKRNFDAPINSHLAKLLILDAYKVNQGAVPRDLTKKLLMIVDHIRNEINCKRIVSVENTNNILTDMKESKKEQIRKACEEVIEEYNYQPNSILEYFSNYKN